MSSEQPFDRGRVVAVDHRFPIMGERPAYAVVILHVDLFTGKIGDEFEIRPVSPALNAKEPA